MTSTDRTKAAAAERADPSGTRTVFDPEGARARQQEQQTGQAIPLQPGGDLEPNDSRVVTGASGSSGVGSPGGSDQDTGGTRYGAPQAEVHDAAAQQQQDEGGGFKADPQLEQAEGDVVADLALAGRAGKDRGG